MAALSAFGESAAPCRWASVFSEESRSHEAQGVLVDLPLEEQVRRGKVILSLLWERGAPDAPDARRQEQHSQLATDSRGASAKALLAKGIKNRQLQKGAVALSLDAVVPRESAPSAQPQRSDGLSQLRAASGVASGCFESDDAAWENMIAGVLSEDFAFEADVDDASTDAPADAHSDDGSTSHSDDGRVDARTPPLEKASAVLGSMSLPAAVPTMYYGTPAQAIFVPGMGYQHLGASCAVPVPFCNYPC
jgi:hypothetical protein